MSNLIVRSICLRPAKPSSCLPYRAIASKVTANPDNSINKANNNTDSTKAEHNQNNKASPEQLALVEEQLVRHLPTLFGRPHPYKLYSPDVTFKDNIRGVQVHGLTSYAIYVGLIKLYYYINYSSVKLELLNLVKSPEESYIRIRWRIIGKPGFIRMILFPLRFGDEIWKDGISTMQVNREAKIYCHSCDNIDVKTDEVERSKKQTIKGRLVDRGFV